MLIVTIRQKKYLINIKLVPKLDELDTILRV